MKLYIKKNKVFFIFLIGLIVWTGIALLYYILYYHDRYQACLDSLAYLHNHPEIPYPFDFVCHSRPDAITAFFNIIINQLFRPFMILFPLIIGVSAIWQAFKELKSGMIKNYLMRMSYRQYVKRTYLSILKSCILMAIPLALLLLGCIIYSRGNFDMTESLENLHIVLGPIFYDHIILFFFVYFVNWILIGIFICNLFYSVAKSCRHIIIACIGGFLTYAGIEVLLEGIAPPVLSYFTKIDIWTWSRGLTFSAYFDNLEVGAGPIPLIILAILCPIISGIVVFIRYKNKENVVMASEN